MSADITDKHTLLSALPSVDDILKSPRGNDWLARYPRKIVLQAVRAVISSKRHEILEGLALDSDHEAILSSVDIHVRKLSSFSLLPVINATGIVLHTNLGRSVLSEKVLKNVSAVGQGYSTLEYDLDTGSRGHRHSHAKRLLREITGAEDALIVNNNAAAVFLCLNTLAKGREVVVSRGELVEIGGSFRIPDVMSASSAILREVGTTNKTHLYDYTHAINENTSLLLKVHQSNYKISGFTDDVGIDELVALGRKYQLPVMFDLGSGCLIDLKRFGIHSEPSVQEIVRTGVDIISFSGDKLLGGPQGGIIVGKKKYTEKILKNPLARAVRIDKLTIAAFEATLMEYMEPEHAHLHIPVLNLLFQSPDQIHARAKKMASELNSLISPEKVTVVKDVSRAGGGSLPEIEFPTFAVSIRPGHITLNELESRLRAYSPPIIARIQGSALLLDARTIRKHEMKTVVRAVAVSLTPAQVV